MYNVQAENLHLHALNKSFQSGRMLTCKILFGKTSRITNSIEGNKLFVSECVVYVLAGPSLLLYLLCLTRCSLGIYPSHKLLPVFSIERVYEKGYLRNERYFVSQINPRPSQWATLIGQTRQCDFDNRRWCLALAAMSSSNLKLDAWQAVSRPSLRLEGT